MSDRSPEPRWGALDVVGWLLVAQVGSGLWYVLLSTVWPGGVPGDPTIPFMTAAAVSLWAAYGLGPVFTTRSKGEGPRREIGAWIKPEDFLVGGIIGAVTQFPVVWALYFPILWFVDDDPSDLAREIVDRVNGPLDWFLLVVITVVMAPLVEELFFRGLMLTALRRRLETVPAVVVQAAVFAAVHVQLLQFAGLFVMGLVAGALAVRWGRLGPCWAMHAAFNAVTVVSLAAQA